MAAGDPHAGLKAWGGQGRSFHVRPIKDGFLVASHDGGGGVEEMHSPSHDDLAMRMRAELMKPAAAQPDGKMKSAVMAGKPAAPGSVMQG